MKNSAETKKSASPKNTPGKGEGGVRVRDAEFAAGAARRDQVPLPEKFDDAPEIAFAGRSNVGKSSLLNMLLSRRGLARTSRTPGCTRQINFFDVTLAKATPDASPRRLVFVDLPGYGYAKVSKTEARAWKDVLEGYLQERPTLRAVVVLVDVRRGIEREEEELIEFVGQRPEIAVIVAATKVDKLSRSDQKPAVARLMKAARAVLAAATTERSVSVDVVATSAETGAGRELLWSRVLDAAAPRPGESTGA